MSRIPVVAATAPGSWTCSSCGLVRQLPLADVPSPAFALRQEGAPAPVFSETFRKPAAPR